MGESYLNHGASAATVPCPRPRFPVFALHLAPAQRRADNVEPYQPQKDPRLKSNVAGGSLEQITTGAGTGEERAVLQATGSPRHRSVSLIWGTQVGSRVSGHRFRPDGTPMATVTVAADGRLEAPLSDS